MKTIEQAIKRLDKTISEKTQHHIITFDDFLKMVMENPSNHIQNIFQIFYSMVKSYVGEGVDEYPDDPESIGFVLYDCNKLFVENSDQPFFADRLFANRFFNHVEALKRGAQQNKIYIFDGPPGCGKSTFLNILLLKFEEYINTKEGCCYEVVWRLDRKKLGGFAENKTHSIIEKLTQILNSHDGDSDSLNLGQELNDTSFYSADPGEPSPEDYPGALMEDYIEIPCPSHDHPILMIPKHYRRAFFDDLFKNDEIKWKLFTEKEYNWVFRDNPCTICNSLFEALLQRLKKPAKVFQMLYARPYRFNRRLGEGISVFNPGDKPMRFTIMSNPMLQRRINDLLKDSNQVKYIFSRYAKTNNGIYALMDIKSHNTERLIELHNIISEGVHKVEDIEENVNSLFIALMNPEDKQNVQSFKSFSDRIEYIKIPYVLDLNTEVEIYRNIFGRRIDDHFLPRVLHNFARVILATRLNLKSEALLEWIKSPNEYGLYCDENLQLLKMEIYTGHIPSWLSEEDRKRFTAKRRRLILAESESEGEKGFSGRDSIKIFNEFFSAYAKDGQMINMLTLYRFFTTVRQDLSTSIPKGFMDSLLRMYNYTILQEVKEALYNYNENQIARDLKNYMFAINFEVGTTETNRFTKEKIDITHDFFSSIERRLLGAGMTKEKRAAFRYETQKEYAAKTLTQDILLEGKAIEDTELYHNLMERYVYNLKEKVLDPFLENENFRNAIKDYAKDEFKTYDKRIRDEVTFLINNLCNNFAYTEQGAKEVCIYVIDNDLADTFVSL